VQRRWPVWQLWVLLVIGIALVVAPFAMSLPSKASGGQRMLNAFHPLMAPAHVKETANYYYDTFEPLKPVAIGAVAASAELPKLMAALGTVLHMTPAQVEAFLGKTFPAMGGLLSTLPKDEAVFEKVPSGLAFYHPLVTTMQANVTNYRQVDSLPNFNDFTWFFVVPGALIIIFAGWALIAGVRRRSRPETV
jgi:hypothetical protein